MRCGEMILQSAAARLIRSSAFYARRLIFLQSESSSTPPKGSAIGWARKTGMHTDREAHFLENPLDSLPAYRLVFLLLRPRGLFAKRGILAPSGAKPRHPDAP